MFLMDAQAEQKLKQSEARLRSLIDNAPYGVYQSDAQNLRFLDVNPALVEMLGYSSRQELLNIEIPRDVYAEHGACEAGISGFACVAVSRGMGTENSISRSMRKTFRNAKSWNSSYARLRRWKRLEIWQVELRTILTTCS
jgi:PAS domain-containing protein